MENEKQEQIVSWDDIGGDYVKLDKDKAKLLLLIDWKLEHIKKFKDEEASKQAGHEILKDQIQFSATVLSEDGQPASKVFTTTSYNALKGLKDVLKGKNNKTPVLIRLKKIGEGKSTVYDIEAQEIPKK